MNKKLLATAAAALITSSYAAHAVPVTFDFTGTGNLCTYTGGFSDSCATTAFTGAVSIDVLASGPSGPDAAGDGITNASDNDSWVQSDFLIQWGGNSFNPGPVPGLTYAFQFASVWNDLIGLDTLTNEESYQGFVPGTPSGTYYLSYASLHRSTQDTTWLSDLSFNTTVGLAPNAFPSDGIYFGNFTEDANGRVGYYGNIQLGTFVQRVTAVPEPSSWVLLGLGLAGLGVLSRRPRQQAYPQTR